MRIELCNCTSVLLEEIGNPKMYRKDVAQTYALALKSSEDVDWKRVNEAIIERWSTSALVYIKELAWSGKAFDRPVHVKLDTGKARADEEEL